jgi:integrase
MKVHTMPKPSQIPKYCCLRSKQRKEQGLPPLSYVRIQGHVRYLGVWNSPESQEAYKRALLDMPAPSTPASTEPPPPAEAFEDGPDPLAACREAGQDLLVLELLAAYLDYAKGYYVKNGRPTGQIPNIKRAIRLTNSLYGHTRALEFGPMALEKVRDHMVKFEGVHSGNRKPLRYTRSTINSTCESIKRIFKWAVSKQLIPETVHRALLTLPGLKRGRTIAREPAPIRPVANKVIDATLPHLSTVVADMVRFQRLTGCRPGEVCDIRPMDVDRGGEVWQYRPASHKTEHRGRERVVFIGPKAKAILVPYLLKATAPDAYCFLPAESAAKANEKQRTLWGQARRRRKPRPKRTFSTHYEKEAYRRAIARGVSKANKINAEEAIKSGTEPAPIPDWSPNQLRHSAATEIRRKFGLEAAQTVLGHAKADVTQIYAERDYTLAASIMEKIG